MSRILRIIFGLGAVLAILLAGSSQALATQPNPDHQVWVCKYVGQPGDFETLKPGKNPIIVDVAAADDYVGADFADGQNHSLVIDLATDENTGKGEKYTGDAECPSYSPTPSPSSSPTPSDSPSPSATPEPSPSDTPEPSTSPTPIPSVTPTLTPSSPARTAPPTDVEETPATYDDNTPGPLLLILFAALLGTTAWSLRHKPARRRR